jgi:hypothetical protein
MKEIRTRLRIAYAALRGRPIAYKIHFDPPR